MWARAHDFDQLRAELLREHDAQSTLEFELVERLAGILWRIRRVPFFEAAILGARHSECPHIQLPNFHRAYQETDEEGKDENDEEEANRQASVHFGQALIDDARFNDALGKLARHEATLMNAVAKTLQMLLLLQDKRGTWRGSR